MKKRIDLGTRIAGDKGRLADEFVTKSQLVTPDGNALETLANGDLVVPTAVSNGNIDGGMAASIYLTSQIIDGENA